MHLFSLDNTHERTEICMRKSLEEQFGLGLQMADEGKMLLASGVRMQTPGISDADLQAEVFNHLYRNFFSKIELERIAAFIRSYHINKSNLL